MDAAFQTLLFCRATVVKEFNTFWVAAVKATVKSCSAEATTTSTSGATTTSTSGATTTSTSGATSTSPPMFLVNAVLFLMLVMKLAA